jgi:hypothetical protein
MAKTKKTKETPTQVWKFTKSQTLLLTEQARIHARELAPLQGYQSRSQNDLLNSFLVELGIPEGTPLTVDLNQLQFTLKTD